ncbi:MAG TPA: tetratricopeptide repeat protein, partial [Allocoleopsis sp.]
DEFSANDVTVAGEEGVPTAIWLNADSGVPPIPPSGTGLTQAIGRPYPEEAQIPTSAPAPVAKGVMRQFSKPLTLLAILISILTVGLAAVALQNVMPELFANRRSGQTPDSTPTPTVPLLTSTNSVELVTYGSQLLQKQDYAQALKYYDRAIEVKPDNASAYAGRCETLNHLKRPEEAIVSCNDALAYQPNYPEALWSKGNALLQQGRTYEALKLYEDVTYLKGNFAPAWVKKGVALQALGRSAEAVYALDQAIALQRNSAEAWSTRGAALYRLQRYDEALVSLDKALQLQNPDDPQTVQLRQQAKAKIKS